MEDLLFIKGRFKNDVRLNVEKLISAAYIQEGREREIKTRVSSSTPCSAHLTPRINGNAKNLLVRSTGDSQIQGLLLVTLISTRSAGIREEIDWCQLFLSSSLFYVRIKRCYSKKENFTQTSYCYFIYFSSLNLNNLSFRLNFIKDFILLSINRKTRSMYFYPNGYFLPVLTML